MESQAVPGERRRLIGQCLVVGLAECGNRRRTERKGLLGVHCPNSRREQEECAPLPVAVPGRPEERARLADRFGGPIREVELRPDAHKAVLVAWERLDAPLTIAE